MNFITWYSTLEPKVSPGECRIPHIRVRLSYIFTRMMSLVTRSPLDPIIFIRMVSTFPTSRVLTARVHFKIYTMKLLSTPITLVSTIRPVLTILIRTPTHMAVAAVMVKVTITSCVIPSRCVDVHLKLH